MDMKNAKIVSWILRIAVAGEFAGHGAFALQGKEAWLQWISQLTGASPELAGQLLLGIGAMDLLVAFVVLIKPWRPLLLWATFWGFWTALVRPIVGEPVWDFIERWANWGAPLALYFLLTAEKKYGQEESR